MPSIPQSLLWISLVVLWLFVLVPMLISKRDAVRRTSDVALATRVLNGATSGTAAASAGDRPPGTSATRTGGRPTTTSTTKTSTTTTTMPTMRTTKRRRRRRWSSRRPSSKTPSPTISTSTSSMSLRAHCRSVSPTRAEELAEARRADTEFRRAGEENVDTAVYEVATDEYEDEGRRHRRRVRVRRRLVGPRGARGGRSADGGLADGRAAAPATTRRRPRRGRAPASTSSASGCWW